MMKRQKKLADHGYIAVYHGSELISHMSNPLIRGNRIYIASTNTSEGIEYFDELKGQLKRLLRKDDFHIIHLNNEELLEINANYERFLNMPLGIFKTTVKKGGTNRIIHSSSADECSTCNS